MERSISNMRLLILGWRELRRMEQYSWQSAELTNSCESIQNYPTPAVSGVRKLQGPFSKCHLEWKHKAIRLFCFTFAMHWILRLHNLDGLWRLHSFIKQHYTRYLAMIVCKWSIMARAILPSSFKDTLLQCKPSPTTSKHFSPDCKRPTYSLTSGSVLARMPHSPRRVSEGEVIKRMEWEKGTS